MITWQKEEPGWYTHPILGGIYREQIRGWYWYPLNPDRERVGPFRTLKEAREVAESEMTE